MKDRVNKLFLKEGKNIDRCRGCNCLTRAHYLIEASERKFNQNPNEPSNLYECYNMLSEARENIGMAAEILGIGFGSGVDISTPKLIEKNEPKAEKIMADAK